MTGLISKPKTPTLAPPTPMPTPDDQALLNERKRQAAQMAMSGRQGTVLTQTDKLG